MPEQKQVLDLIPIQFHNTTLYMVERDGNPYTPLRPIVEGMGLAWQSQHAKVCANRERFRVTEIVMQLPGDDQRRCVCCLPLNKLSGWLLSINPKKVKPSLRKMIAAYQTECDDVLWDYWTRQRGISSDQRSRREECDSYDLASACFEQLAALFRSIGQLTEDDAHALANLGHERAEDWRFYYQRRSGAIRLQ